MNQGSLLSGEFVDLMPRPPKRDREKWAAYLRAWRRERRAWLSQFKTDRGCCRCGERRPAALDFHHRNPAEKSFMISRAVADGKSMAETLREIEKCDLICANCHRVEHAEERERELDGVPPRVGGI